ncbi:MAG: DUF4868 domain-containing protein [Lachnospiraceae bacterium]|nr:DUF4868 domain-containing protein [Lachnospiraceae bacterium]
MKKICDLKQKTEELLNGKIGIKLYFVLKTAEGRQVKAVNIADETLTASKDDTTSETLLKGFKDSFMQKMEGYEEEDEILALSSADERKNAIFYYDLDELPEEMQELLNVMNQNQKYETFQFAEDSLNEIAAFLIVIGNSKEKLSLYRQQYPISLLKRDKCMLTPIPHANRLKKITEDILRVDFNFQFFSYQNVVYVTDVDRIEKICGFNEIIKKEAARSIVAIESAGLIDDIEVLRDELDNTAFARKLTRIYRDSKVLKSVNKSEIIDFTRKHNYFQKNPLKLNATGDRFILDTKRSKNTFMKLLNDDLLTSALTKAEYESLAKNSVG